MIERPKILTRNLDQEDSHTLTAYHSRGGYQTLARALKDKTPDQLIGEIKESGLRGRGGAGFPTGIKWGFINKKAGKPIYLVLNADESEPGTFKDRLILNRLPHLMLEGALIAAYALDVHHIFFYIRGEYAREAEAMARAVAEAREAGYIGRGITGGDFDVEFTIYRGAGAYICGEETALLNSLEGKKGYPRTKPPFPAAVGLYGCPTVVNNVETIATVPWIIENGAAAYKQWGTEKSPGTRLACVSGRVKQPGVHEVPLSIPLKELIEFDCGGLQDGCKLKAVVPGGASTNPLTPEEVERCIMDFEGLREFGTFLGSGSTIVIDESCSMPEVAYSIAHFFSHESCGQCSPCREGTGWISTIIHRILAGQGGIKDLDLITNIAGHMLGTTICPLADADAAPMIAYVTKWRDEWEAFIRSGKQLLEPEEHPVKTPAHEALAAVSS